MKKTYYCIKIERKVLPCYTLEKKYRIEWIY